MRTLYLDLFSGISGDMFIGALIDLGLDARQLELELTKLPLDGYHLHVTRSQKGSIAGTKFDVHLSSDHNHRHGHDEHSHESHSHAHSHAHAAEHSHTHLHGHAHSQGSEHAHDHSYEHSRTFAEIRQLITRSARSNWVKEKSVAVFQ